MAEESKQFTAFMLGSMGLFECDRMPFVSVMLLRLSKGLCRIV